MIRRLVTWSAATICLALMGAIGAHAQTRIFSSVIGSGGGAASSGNIFVAGTIGQAVIGPTGSAATKGFQGFWYMMPTPEGPSSVPTDGSDMVAGDAALASWPNPITAEGEIRVRLAAGGPVSLKLYDALGREVRTLVEGEREAGTFTVLLDAKYLESGSYMAQLIAGNAHHAIKLVVVK